MNLLAGVTNVEPGQAALLMRGDVAGFEAECLAVEIVGELEPIPIKELAGGLENLGEGLSLLREGKVSGTKLGYKLE